MVAHTIQSLLAQDRWHAERRALHDILTGAGLTASVKWNKLCYLHQDANVAILHVLKDSIAPGFFKGALLDDPEGLLRAPGPNSQAMRRMHFTSLDGIEAGRAALEGFVAQAIAAEEKGLEVEFTERHDLDLPEELTAALDDDPDLSEAWQALTPGRQRGWVLHVADAKQSDTRRRRIDKARPAIHAGKGPNER